ncbi:glycosyltransferase [Planococcus donghaensis]|uniref:Glycosyl transferase n=1 Tax=Planococcus donghaensis TaxID=414778 RepID=A0A1C7EEU3_9BACL|nr:glycosyltransferase [Planococcus donghaensis]ANU22484.1 glycosyl transferase [Planococcus donghaensis]
MKVLFCHDGPLKKDEENNYYGTAHNDKTFKRYYHIGNELSAIIRVKDVSKSEAEKQLSKISVSPFRVIQCPNISNLKGGILNKIKAKRIIENEVKNTDYVIARLPSIIGFIAIDYAKKNKIPYLVELVACPWDAFWNHSIVGKIVAPSMYLATKKRVKKAPYVVYVTNNFLQKRYPTFGKNISCSNVALQKFNSEILEKRLKKINEMNQKQKIIIGTTAAIDVKYKGQQYIIKALGELEKNNKNIFEYQLVGGGNNHYLKKLAKKYNVENSVQFLGSKPHKEIFNWLETIDIYTQPSRQEGLPRSLVEAMSRALPAFGANTAGIPELIEKKYIFSNKKNNIEEICEILLSISKEELVSQANKNFSEANKYEAVKIEEKRKGFFEQFKLQT